MINFIILNNFNNVATESSKTSFKIRASTFKILILLINYIGFRIFLIFVFSNIILIKDIIFYDKIISF